jgi:phage shock protein PspC (stress-responsive transcriptional regulator)
MKTKLARSQTDRMVAGVCGGLGAYLGIEAVWVRLFFVLITIVPHGFGLLLYLILWIIMPEAGREEMSASQTARANVEEMAGKAQELAQNVGQAVHGVPNRQAGIIIGAALVLVGGLLLLGNLNLFWWLSFDKWWPLLLILGGAALLVNRARSE